MTTARNTTFGFNARLYGILFGNRTNLSTSLGGPHLGCGAKTLTEDSPQLVSTVSDQYSQFKSNCGNFRR